MPGPVGGVALEEQMKANPVAFRTLLGKILPMQTDWFRERGDQNLPGQLLRLKLVFRARQNDSVDEFPSGTSASSVIARIDRRAAGLPRVCRDPERYSRSLLVPGRRAAVPRCLALAPHWSGGEPQARGTAVG